MRARETAALGEEQTRDHAVWPSAIGRPLFLFAILIAALAPMFIYPLGIAGDYPNHLARVYIEHRLADSASLAEHFTLDWGIYPDLAMDLFMRPLMAVTDPYTAGSAFNVLAVAMLPIGVALLSWATGGRVGLPVAASVLLIYGMPLAWGFINFVFAAGLALCLFALWVRLRPGWRRAGLFVPLAVILFFSHVLGFLLFGFLMLAYEIGRFLAGERGPLPRFAAGLVLRDGLYAIVPFTLFAASLRARLSGLETEISGFGSLMERVQALVAPFNFDDGVTSLVLLCGFYGSLFFAFRRRWLTLAPAMKPVVLASVALVLFVPVAFSGISFLHIRFGAIPAALLLGGASLTRAGQARSGPLLAALAVLTAIQQVSVHDRMALYDQAQRRVREAVSTLPDGARLLVGADYVTPLVIRLDHAPAFVVIEADGYVANLFTNTSPVNVTERAAPLHRPQAGPLSRESLLEGKRRDPPPPPASGIQDAYHHGWPQTFNALFWFDLENGAALHDEYLTKIVENEIFHLYSISPAPR